MMGITSESIDQFIDTSLHRHNNPNEHAYIDSGMGIDWLIEVKLEISRAIEAGLVDSPPEKISAFNEIIDSLIKEAGDEMAVDLMRIAGIAGNLVNKKPKAPGYVYLLKTSSGYWKIGYSSRPDDRLYTFKTKLPFIVEYECLIETNNMRRLERELHWKYEPCRAKGTEFFKLEDGHIAEIKKMAERGIYYG